MKHTPTKFLDCIRYREIGYSIPSSSLRWGGVYLWLVALLGILTSCGSEQSPSAKVSTVRQLSHAFSTTLVKNSIDETVLTLSNTGTDSVPVAAPKLTGSSNFAFVSDSSCAGQLAAGASCPVTVRFTPSGTGEATATLSIAEPNSASIEDRVSLTGSAYSLPKGTYTSTANPLVAQYTISPGVAANVSVQFGLNTNYGLKTWTQPTSNGSVSIFVAGMRQNTRYHLKATVQLPNGNTLQDVDQTFTTSAFPSSLVLPTLAVSTPNGLTPQPGIELVASPVGASTNFLQAFAVDLEGNLIWGYTFPEQQNAIVQPIKLLDNGHMILIISQGSQFVFAPPASDKPVTLREIDLAGNTIRELTLADLNAKLSAAGNNLTFVDFHHDVTPLPNGHFLLIASTVKEYGDVTGFPGPNTVLGDVVIDLDPNFNPVWVWNEFDHLDVNRHPTDFPDWTHTNAVLYSKDDGNILVSSRHQSWIMKVDYEDGAGSGNIIWRLGEGGDFKLVNGTDPTDWFYGQHQPSFLSPNTTGVFTLSMMDNGYARVYPPTSACNSSAPAITCGYSRAPVFRVDEGAKTATLVYPNQRPYTEYSFWGGGTTNLANGNLEYDLCAEPNSSSIVREIVPENNPMTVWELDIGGENAYRANRIPSLYPGVQW